MASLSRLLVTGALVGVAACGDRVDADPPPPPPTGIPSAAFEARGPVVGPSRHGTPTQGQWGDAPLVQPPIVQPLPDPSPTVVNPPPPPPGPGATGVPL